MARSSTKSQRQRMTRGESLILFVQSHAQTLSIIVLAIFFSLWIYPDPPPTLAFLRGLHSLAHPAGHSTAPTTLRVALGWNTNVDCVVAYDRIFPSSTSGGSMEDHGTIDTMDTLLSAFTFWFAKSAAAERHVENNALFQALIAKIQDEECVYGPGGNAALIANQLARESIQVSLGGPIGPRLKALLHENVTTVAETETDEIHVIVEYPKGATFNGKQSQRANRFILTRDERNAEMFGWEQWIESIAKEASDAVVVSGFHLLNDQPKAVRTKRLAQAQEGFGKIDLMIPIHLEFASMSDDHFVREMAHTLFPAVDSLGLNEQELLSLYLALDGPLDESEGITRDSLARQIPAPQAVAQALRFVLEKFGPQAPGGRGLQRIHFHSFAFHIIAEVTGPRKLYRNAKAAVAYGSATATLRACNSTMHDIQEEDGQILAPKAFSVVTPTGTHPMQVDDVFPVAVWKHRIDKHSTIRFNYAPVVVCRQVVQTVGLGDSISAAALSLSMHGNDDDG